MNIAHRDLKPENILVKNLADKSKCRIKIIDWGFGKLLKDSQFFNRICGTNQYAAPEVFEGKYTVACDIWSLGVLAFVMLTGNVPFRGTNSIDTILQVKKGVINFRKTGFCNLSTNAKDFINKLLQKDTSKRLSALSALKHCWISQFNSQKLEPVDFKETLKRLNSYNISNHFGLAIINLINNHFSTSEQKQKLQQIFSFLDTNGDGLLSLEELMEGYSKIYGRQLGNAIATQTFHKLDVNNSGTVQFSEFIAYGKMTEKQKEKDKLQQAFNMFDIDNNGTISFKQISDFLKGNLQGIEEKDLENFIMLDLKVKLQKVEDGTLEINFQQFYMFMLGLMSKVDGIKESKKRESLMRSGNEEKQGGGKRIMDALDHKIKRTESMDA